MPMSFTEGWRAGASGARPVLLVALLLAVSACSFPEELKAAAQPGPAGLAAGARGATDSAREPSTTAVSIQEERIQEPLGQGRGTNGLGESPVGSDVSSGTEEVDQPQAFDWTSLTREQAFAYYNELQGDAYPLDAVRRHLENQDERVPCNGDDLTDYRGETIAFMSVRVHPAFADRLRRLEAAASEVGLEVYGRPPTRMRHIGGYVCRKSRFRSLRISEHALGNAIDVLGFDFGPAESKEAAAHLPTGLRWSFHVRVDKHWQKASSPAFELHAEFLRRLTARVVEESIFRVVLGPSHRGHADHFHFDMSPWRYTHL